MLATLLVRTCSNLSVKALVPGDHYFQIQSKIRQTKMRDTMTLSKVTGKHLYRGRFSIKGQLSDLRQFWQLKAM